MIIALLLFWLSVLALVHSYILYPVSLKLFSIGNKENEILFAPDDMELPHVYVVMSVHNEEKVIEGKLDSTFSTSYPLEKLHVFIGSDNSIDRTNDIIAAYNSPFAEKFFIPFNQRSGKPNVLNQLVNLIQARQAGDNTILLFTDANVLFGRETIYELVKNFKNPDILLVGGNILNKEVQKDGISLQEKSYIAIENKIKHLEGLNWGTMIGAFGGCFAMKANCWSPIPPNFIVDDFYLTMNVLAKKGKAVFEKKAVCYEDVSSEMQNEFSRKARIQAGNFQNLAVFWKLVFRFDAVAYCFFSHKVLRWLGPVLFILTYVSNILLLPYGQFYCFALVVQNLLLLSPVIDGIFKRIGVHLILLRFASYFIMMNIALAKGFVMYIKGIETNIWNRTERNI